jgi:hypothetical protein
VFSKLPEGVQRDKSDKGRLFVDKDDLIEYWAPKEDKEGRDISHLKDYWIFPLEACIHSGVCLYLSGGCAIDRQWDVSQLGAVFVSKKEARLSKSARELALSLIKTWNLYLSGQVYSFSVTDPDGEDVDSCGGFFTDNIEKDILVYCRATIDRKLPLYEAKQKELASLAIQLS